MALRSKTELFDVGHSSDFWTNPPITIFKYSEHIHRDRHIFFGRAMFGADDTGVDMMDNPAENSRLPCLKKVHLSLDVTNDVPKIRFSESLNTYVDTRKRIRMVSSVDDYDKRAGVCTSLPSITQNNSLGEILKTIPLRRTCASVPASNIENNTNDEQRPSFRRGNTFSQPSIFHTGSETDRLHFMPCMPTRFRFASKPLSLWRQKTEPMISHKRSYKIRFRNG